MLVNRKLGFQLTDGEDIIAFGVNQNSAKPNLLQILPQWLAAIPGVKGYRIAGNVNVVLLEKRRDVSHHIDQDFRFLGVGSPLFSDQSYPEGNNLIANLYRHRQQILTVEGFVLSPTVPVVAVGENLAATLLNRIVHRERDSTSRFRGGAH